MQPDAMCAHREGLLNGAREERAAEAAFNERRCQSEVRDLDAFIGVTLQLEETRGVCSDVELPDADAWRGEMMRQRLVAPLESIVPIPTLADVAIQPSIDRNRAARMSDDVRVRIGELLRTELSAVVEREIRSNDVDARQTSAP